MQNTCPWTVLLLGSGGREHALAKKIAESQLCNYLYVAPGNAGTEMLERTSNVPLDLKDFAGITDFIRRESVNMVIVGPEDPLINGLYEYIQETSLPVVVVGPSQKGALLEGSKLEAKLFMRKHGIRTADFRVFSKEGKHGEVGSYEGAQHFVNTTSDFNHFVFKADGPFLGKGVVVTSSKDELLELLKTNFENEAFGQAGKQILLEEKLEGEEFSITIMVDSNYNYVMLPIAKDYKRVGEGDTGKNTGGMGCISPVPFVTEAVKQKTITEIVERTVAGLKADRIAYKGLLYIQCMLVEGEIYVIEYNARGGDPETEVIMPRLTSDLLALFIAAEKGRLHQKMVEIDDRACATVVLASAGYPGDYEKGKLIELPEDLNEEETYIYAAGMKIDGESCLTNGGRVMAISSFGTSVAEAVAIANEVAEQVQFEGKYYRSDIGYQFRSITA